MSGTSTYKPGPLRKFSLRQQYKIVKKVDLSPLHIPMLQVKETKKHMQDASPEKQKGVRRHKRKKHHTSTPTLIHTSDMEESDNKT